MFVKYYNIKGGRKLYKDFVLLNDVRDFEYLIYLSYIINDLLLVGGENLKYLYVIYYVICDK